MLIACFLLFFTGQSQVLPVEGSSLSFRIIGFSFPVVQNRKNYKIEIAKGNFYSIDSFKKNIVKTVEIKQNKTIAEVPSFGCLYTWRVVYSGDDMSTKIVNSPLYHFAIQTNASVDPNKQRLRISHPAAGQLRNDYYVAVDANPVLYDMNGNAVWFSPDTNEIHNNVQDMKFTADGTITYLCGTPMEVNLCGKVLWKILVKNKLPGESLKHSRYHHEFTKLANGHYMALTTQLLMCKQVSRRDSSYIVLSDAATEQNGYKTGRFGSLIEYDEKGNTVWTWESSKHLIGSDFDYFNPDDTSIRFDPHLNSFFFDQKHNVIYVSAMCGKSP